MLLPTCGVTLKFNSELLVCISDFFCSRLGLIKWLENTCTLKEFLKNSMSEEEDINYNR